MGVLMNWTGNGAIQWEHQRVWDLDAGAKEMCLAEGALSMPAGFLSWSIFVRKTDLVGATTMELELWTAPIFYQPLDTDIAQAPGEQLYQLTMEPATGLQMTGGGKGVFAAKLKSDQPMGTLLFWRMHNTGGSNNGRLTADIFIVPNFAGVTTSAPIGRTVQTGAPAVGLRQRLNPSTLR